MTFDEQRARMVDLQLARRGISDQRVLAAFRAVPRESFAPTDVFRGGCALAGHPHAASLGWATHPPSWQVRPRARLAQKTACPEIG